MDGSTTKTKPTFSEIKQAASGRWREIITVLTAGNLDFDTTRETPCPKCEGETRFHPFKDFDQTGGVTCRHCHNGKTNPKCGDGIATVAWLNNVSIKDAAQTIADHLGMTTGTAPKGNESNTIGAVCADKRMPVEAFKQFGAAVDQRGKLTVARVPVYNEAGEPFSYFDLSPGKKGWFKKGTGNSGLFLPGRLPAAGETWLAVEGVKDAAVLVGLGFNAVGLPTSKMNKKYAALFTGCDIVLVPDLDSAGIEGAQQSGGRLIGIAASVKVARLPGEVVQSKGPDVRDTLKSADGESLVRNAITNAKDWQPVEREPKPKVYLKFEEADVSNRVISAINSDSSEMIYQRSGLLVHVATDPALLRGTNIPDDQLRIRQLPAPLLRERITSAVELVTEGEEEDKRNRPPGWLVAAIHQRGSYPADAVPPLSGIVRCPTIRPDGSVIQSAGYDAATGLLYCPDGIYPPIPEHPSQTEAATAAAELLEVIYDFPFQDECHRSVWLALVLTLVGRPAINGPCPLFAVDANTRGSGKSLTSDLAGIIVTGSEMPRKAWPNNDEETRKTITSIAIEAIPAVLLDNVASMLGGPSFDAALTATSWQDRILGKSETTGKLPLSTVWIATGNNLVFGADTARRTLYCRLESPLEHPEDREDFRHPNIVQFVRSNRHRLATAAVTILRGYFSAGCPSVELQSWGSYSEWSKLIRAAIVWAGLPDPAGTRTLVRQTDRSAELLGMLMDGIDDAAPGEGLTTAEMVTLLTHPLGPDESDPYESLRAVVNELCEPKLSGGRLVYSARRLGNRLKSFCGRVCGGRKLIRSKERTKAGYRWLIEKSEQPGIHAPDTPVTPATAEIGASGVSSASDSGHCENGFVASAFENLTKPHLETENWGTL